VINYESVPPLPKRKSGRLLATHPAGFFPRVCEGEYPIPTAGIADNIVSVESSVVWVPLWLIIVVVSLVVVRPAIEHFVVKSVALVALVTTYGNTPCGLATFVQTSVTCCFVVRAFVIRAMNVKFSDRENYIWYQKAATLDKLLCIYKQK